MNHSSREYEIHVELINVHYLSVVLLLYLSILFHSYIHFTLDIT
jgi:hypothetical protein